MSDHHSSAEPSDLTGIELLRHHTRELLQRRHDQKLLRRLGDYHLPTPYPSRSCQSSCPSSWPAAWHDELSHRAEDLAKKLSQMTDLPSPWNFNINDYLGLERSGVCSDHIIEIAKNFPVGGLSSRLLGGNHPIISLAEDIFSSRYDTVSSPKSSTHTPSGYSATYFHSGTTLNHTLPTLLKELVPSPSDILFFSDELNHASIIHGIGSARLPPSQKYIFKHLDFDHLSQLLSEAPSARVRVIFLESLYSMDGDGPTAKDLSPLLSDPSIIIALDEAHSFGVMGRRGGGLTDELLSGSHPALPSLISLTPCGKALASQGAFLLAPEFMRNAVINFAKPWIYTTAPAPLICASVALRLLALPLLSGLRGRLMEVSKGLADELSMREFNVVGRGSPLLGCMTRSIEQALDLERKLAQKGLMTKALRYPTVPKDRPRLRLSLNPFLSNSDITHIADLIARARD